MVYFIRTGIKDVNSRVLSHLKQPMRNTPLALIRSMKLRPAILISGIILSLLFTAVGSYAQPSWLPGYPQILSGASSVDIGVKTDANGLLYYAIYSGVQPAMTSVQLKNDALVGSNNPNLVRRGSVAITSNSLQTIKQATLPSDITYHIYVVAESNSLLMSDDKISYTARVFPKRQQEFYNFSNAYINSYLMYFPEDYYKTTTPYPLLVFLGGTGEMSKGGPPNPDLLLLTGLPQVIGFGKEIPMVVASPQGIWTWDQSPAAVDAYIEFLKVTYRVDASQIFLTGLSEGGRGVFQYTNLYPTKIKAIVPISTWPEMANVHNFIDVPVWGFMGDKDSPGQLIAWINALRSIGGNGTYTEYPGAHTSEVWNAVYNGSRGDDIYLWMLTGKGQNQPPSNILPLVDAGPDQTVSLPLSQLNLIGTASDLDGTVASYIWTEISGPPVTMTNVNSPTLTLTNITSGTYSFQLFVHDNSGGFNVDEVKVYATAGGVTVSREFDVNMTWAWNKQGGAWNDFLTSGGGTVGNSATLFDNRNIPSTISLSVSAPFQDGANNHGVTPGLYPNNVMQYYLRSTTTKVGSLKLSGLNLNSVYDVSMLSSNVDSWYPSDTRITVAGQSATVNARGNANQLANFQSIAPNAAGEITITVAPATTNSANVGVLNALIIKERPVVGGSNAPPVANAGPDQQIVLPVGQLQLFGTATDADGTIASLLWTEISGPTVTMTSTTTSTLTLTNILAGTYIFQLSVQDNGGAVTNDQVTVTVTPVINVAPVVNAGADQLLTLPISQVQLTGTATDSDGTIASLLWTEISGPTVTMTNTTTLTLALTNLLTGTYVFQLSAKDNGGTVANDQVTVMVAPAVITGTREFDINVTWAWNKQGSLPWNDFVTTNVVGNSASLFDKTGTPSPITISIVAAFQVDGSNNHGAVPGLYPNNVMMFYLRSTQTVVGSLKLAGLNTSRQYDVSIMSSNADVWYPSDTRLTVQGLSATVNAKGNKTQLVNFTNISPTALGEIPIIVAPATTNSANVGVINAIILTEHDAVSLPGARTTQTVTITGNEKPSLSQPIYVNVFPNPVEDEVNVEISSSLSTPETFSIEFVDIRGAQVYAHQVESQDGTNQVAERIPADFMQSGFYIMAVRSRQSGVQYFKILKK